MDHKLIFWALTALCGGYALLRGGAPERIGAATIILGSLLTVALGSAWADRFEYVEVGVFLVDVVVLAVFVLLAVFADRFWPLWVSALQAIGVLAHLARALEPNLMPWAYGVALAMGVYPMLLLLALGTWRHRKRLAAGAADPSWSRSSAR
ncbi:MAG TPA: hypothetical protein VF662_11450 [Allosphingosinicella sp.]|jgi:hypothetical protein